MLGIDLKTKFKKELYFVVFQVITRSYSDQSLTILYESLALVFYYINQEIFYNPLLAYELFYQNKRKK